LFRIDASGALNVRLITGMALATLPSRSPVRADGEDAMIEFDADSQTTRQPAALAYTAYDLGFLTQVAAAKAGIGGYSARRRASPEFATAVYDAVDQFAVQDWPKATIVRLV
jgi:hypothetical protein